MKKVEVVNDLCIGCGMCTSNAAFQLNSEGKSEVVPANIDEDTYNMADVCPTGAIIVTEEATEEN